MSLEIAVRHRVGSFSLDAEFATGPGVTALFGRSGAGKTTLAGLVAGLQRPEAGRIVLGGAVLTDTAARVFVPPHRRRIGVVFQEGRLFPHLSVRGNLRYGARLAPRGAPGADADRIVALLGLESLLARRPRHLSGGERQRVAIGRALLMRPRALVLDEPLAGLDEARKAEILPYVERLRDTLAIPILYISHAVAEVARLAATVVLLDAGRVVAVGPAGEIFASPAAAPVLGAAEAGAILSARIAGHETEDGLTRLETAAGMLLVPNIDAPVGAAVRVHVHARDVMLATVRPDGLSALNVLPAVVSSTSAPDPATVDVRLDAGGEALLARITARSARALGIAAGAEVHAVLKSVAVDPRDVGRG